jgi:hypothetical protein
MAWRPYDNLIDGELDNRVSGKVTGWIRFFRKGQRPLKVRLDLAGDFHEDIRGKVIRLMNSSPSDRDFTGDDAGTTYMDGFSAVQRGEVGDMTAGLSLGPWTEARVKQLMGQHEDVWKSSGLSDAEREQRRKVLAESYQAHIAAGDLFYLYVPYPYLEWYSERNGRVVLELDPSQVEVLDGGSPKKEKTATERAETEANRIHNMEHFLVGLATLFPDEPQQD